MHDAISSCESIRCAFAFDYQAVRLWVQLSASDETVSRVQLWPPESLLPSTDISGQWLDCPPTGPIECCVLGRIASFVAGRGIKRNADTKSILHRLQVKLLLTARHSVCII